MSIAVVRGDTVLYSEGFGWADEPRNIRSTASTVYHWWSCTKIITAIAVPQLQEAGKLSLADPVIQHLVFFNVEYPSGSSKKVTILNLLNHSSGLPNPSALTLMSWIHHHGETSLNQTDFVYTRAMEAEEAAGAHPLWNVISPLLPLIAPSYIREVAGGHIWMERVYTDQTPPSGLIGSVADAGRLVAAYLSGGILDGQRILSEESVAVMTREGQIDGRSEDSLSYRRQGIGWQVYGNARRWVLTHDGGGPGFSTKIQLYPDEHLGFVLFTNDATCEVWKIVRLASLLKW